MHVGAEVSGQREVETNNELALVNVYLSIDK